MPIRSACLAGLFTAALFSGCTREPSSGASTETTNGLMGSVTDENGKPAARARVSIWDSRGIQRLGTTYTDTSGHWRIDGLSGIVGVDIISEDASRGWWQGGHHWTGKIDTLPSLQLRKLVNLVVSGQKLARLAGTPYSTIDGTFRSIPPGAYTVLKDTSSGSFPVGSVLCGKTTSDTFTSFADSGLLVDDFDDGDSTWTYGPVRNNSVRWYAQEGTSGAHLVAPLVNQGTATPGMETTGAWRGRSLHLKYTVTDSSDFVWAGLNFGERLDFTKFRSFRIRVRGNGNFRVGLDGGLQGGGDFRAEWYATADSVWKEYQFDSPSGGTGTRTYGVFQIVVLALRGSDLWIDDIRIDGLTPENCLP